MILLDEIDLMTFNGSLSSSISGRAFIYLLMILGITNKDIGHQIENIVYLELLRRGYTINIGKSGRGTEVDFVAVRDKKIEYYQVSASVLDENTLKKELESLNQIKDNYPKFLITLDDFTGDYDGIQQVNLIDWSSKK